jgi:hypothetical protein
MESPIVDQLILEGGRGEWGGTPDQIERAFLAAMSSLSEDNPQGALDYSLEALRSPFPSNETAISFAQHSVFFVKILSQRGEISGAQVEDVPGQLFSDNRVQEGSAIMSLKNIRGDRFGTLDATVVADYRRRAEKIIK